MGLFLRLHLRLISISMSSSLTPEKVLHYYSKQWPSKHKTAPACSQTHRADKRRVPICMQPTDAAAFRLKCRKESGPESFPTPPPPPLRCQLICECLDVWVHFLRFLSYFLPRWKRVTKILPATVFFLFSHCLNIWSEIQVTLDDSRVSDDTKCHLSETSRSLLGRQSANFHLQR